MVRWLLVLMWMLPSLLGAAEPDALPWHASWLLEALGVAAALVLAWLLWIVRKVAASFISLVVIMLAAGLILLAVFGRQLGVYDVMLGTTYADDDAPARRAVEEARQRAPEAVQAVEAWRDDAPSFRQFESERAADPEPYREDAPSFEEFNAGESGD